MYNPSFLLRRFYDGFRSSKYFILVSPQKTALAILNTLVILRALELGFGPLGISYITMFNIISYLLVSYVSPMLIYRRDFTRYSLQVSYLALTLASILLSIDSKLVLMTSSIIIFTSSYLIYYTIYVSIKGNGVRDKASYISRFETIGGVSWVIGLLTGFLLTSLFSLRIVPMIVFLIPLTGLVYSLHYYGVPSYNGGLKRSLKIPIKLRYTFRSLLFHSPVKIIRGNVLGVSLSLKYFMLSVFLIQFSISTAFTHLIPYISSEGFYANQVFLLVLFSSFTATFSYGFVGRRFRGRDSLVEALSIRILVYISFAAVFISVFGLADVLYKFVSYIPLFILMGFSWAYITINLSSILLSLKPIEISKVNLIGGLGSISGILVSGYLYMTIAYPMQILFSGLVMGVSLGIVLSKPVIERSRVPFVVKNSYVVSVVHRNNLYHGVRRRFIEVSYR